MAIFALNSAVRRRGCSAPSTGREIRPAVWATPFEATKRVVGFVILLLGATLLAPVPFSHVIPALVIALLAFAFLEEDGVLLCIALAAAIISLAITTAAIWGAVEVTTIW